MSPTWECTRSPVPVSILIQTPFLYIVTWHRLLLRIAALFSLINKKFRTSLESTGEPIRPKYQLPWPRKKDEGQEEEEEEKHVELERQIK